MLLINCLWIFPILGNDGIELQKHCSTVGKLFEVMVNDWIMGMNGLFWERFLRMESMKYERNTEGGMIIKKIHIILF